MTCVVVLTWPSEKEFGQDMFISIFVCTFFMVTCGGLATISQHFTDDEQAHIQLNIEVSEYFDVRPREKRSVSFVIAALFKNAKLLFKDKNYRLYEKPGGYNQATDDFDLLRPNNVERAGNSKWGNFGDTTVMLNELSGKFYMSFWKPIRNTDGKRDLQIDRIRYED